MTDTLNVTTVIFPYNGHIRKQRQLFGFLTYSLPSISIYDILSSFVGKFTTHRHYWRAGNGANLNATGL